MRPLLASAFCVLIATPAKADPGPVVNWLINEPASLFDIGMMQLRMRIENLEKRWNSPGSVQTIGPMSIRSFYRYKTNRISIEGWLDLSDQRPEMIGKAEVNAICANFFFSVRQNAGVVPTTGRVYPEIGENSNFSDFFKHIGYEKKGRPSRHKARLDQIFIIEMKYPVSRFLGSGKGLRYTCSGPLLDTGFSIKEDVME